ncbi:MAG: 30S ribosomal protein S1 [Rickettsiales bacterium]|jgi:small subunit ribosomal protein S1|nr:30S ribosomal protein S1 [Rickettsiales bacterium]
MDFDFEDFEKLLDQYDSEVVVYNEGDIATGTIIDIDNKTVTIDIGGKTVGYISKAEFAGENIAVGDRVEIYIEKIENRKGELIVSRENARKYQSWNELKKCLAENRTVEGKVLGKVKGGFAVEIGDIIAFLPKSQVDTVVLVNTDDFTGKIEKFMVLKVDDIRRNVVVSRRAILEEQRNRERDEILSNIKVGDVMTGMVKNITDYGVFVDFGSFDGLLHLTDISWCRIRHPSEVLKIGQEVQVQVIKYDEIAKKVSLGMKQLQENPWETIEQKFPVNSIVNGRVTNIAQYGVFVEIENGIEGLVHISEMSWFKNSVIPSKILSVGQAVRVMILDISTDHHRISLGIKQCETNPWKEFSDKYVVGDVIEGMVKNITEFGLFVEFESGIDGLVHVSDVDWDESKSKDTLKKYKKNEKISVMLLGSNYEQERISIGIKQLSNENFKDDIQKLAENTRVSCTVKNVRRGFLEVEIEQGLKAIIKRIDISADKKEQKTESFRVSDKLEALISLFDSKTGKLMLKLREDTDNSKPVSQEEEESDEDDFDIEQYLNADTNATLGSVFGNVFTTNMGSETNGGL